MLVRQEDQVAPIPGRAADAEAWSMFLRGSGALDLPPDPVFSRWMRWLHQATGAPVVALCLRDGERRLVTVVDARDGSLRARADLASSEPLRAHLLTAVLRGEAPGAPARYAEASVVVGGRDVGRLAIAAPGPGPWRPEVHETLHNVAEAVSTHLALRLAESEVERSRQLVASHHRIHDMIARAAPLPDVLTAICETIERYDPTLMPCVLLLDAASSTLHSGVGPSLPPWYLAATDGLVIGPNIGTCGPAAWFGRLAVTRDLSQDPNWAPVQDLVTGAGVAHCWSIPVKGADGEVLGTLAFYGRQPREPLPEHVELLEDWSRVAGIAIERSRSLDRLTYDARHDSLTGLPNRGAIFEQLDEAIQRVTPDAALAVLFVDLDGLKTLNDTFGHDRADEMIRQIGRRLAETVGEKNFVGRFGGDEFVVVAEGIVTPREASDLGARLLAAIARPLPHMDTVALTASIGIAMIRTSEVEAREAIRRSDAAMYRAKRSGRDRCVLAEVEPTVHVGRRLQLARLLRGAQTRGELSLVFQPVLDLATMTVTGAEALLRWDNPTLGQVPPAEFVPVAEETGGIVPIGAWALRESCEAMARLAALGHRLELAVNVSGRQISNPDFPVWVRKTLSHAQFPADRLFLEITETALMPPNTLSDSSLRGSTLRELDALGVRLVLDDFGTGYSSLSWLKQHEFGGIKIDHSFIRDLSDDPRDRAIVGGVVEMARALGCNVTAEGVETEGQLAVLRALGCDRVQGFLLMPPVSVDDLADLLTSWPAADRPAVRPVRRQAG